LSLRRALLALIIGVTPCAAQDRPCDPQSPLGPSHDLYCIELIAAPGVTGISGRVELVLPSNPFTVGVTAEGRPRFTPVALLAGLDPQRTYAAWVMSPQMDTVTRLGAVRNGRVELPPIDLDKFTLLVTDEQGTQPQKKSTKGRKAKQAETAVRGRIVLRGQSPSTRLFPPDLMEFSLGAAGTNQMHMDSEAWPVPPVPPHITMLPSEMALRPEVAPFLPPQDTTAPLARPSERVRLSDGDTLRLEAGVVRRTLNGKTFNAYGYNGQYPGALIEVTRGSEITVLFTNHLTQSSTIHFHGVRLQNAFDGADNTQTPVVPGGSFTYHGRFPDAGIYWYHPHVREDVEQELGLYGNIVVLPTSTSFGPVNREETLILDDLLVDAAGPIPLGSDSPTHALMGRFGNAFLVNGELGYRLAVRPGEVVRFYLTNAANARVFNLSFGGARMKVIASDGGPLERETFVRSLVIAPAERYVVDVQFDRTGQFEILNRVRGLDHFFGRFFPEVDTLGVVTVAGEHVAKDFTVRFTVLRRDLTTTRELEPYRQFVDKPPTKALVLTLATHDLPFITQRLMQLDSIYFTPVEWSGTMPMMNWASTGKQVRWVLRDPATGAKNMDIAWRFQRREPVKLRLINERRAFHGMQHPMHVHGQRFLVLAVNGVPNENLSWKDTVLVPAGAVVDILLDTSNPGDWMLHCHIGEHLSAGMMMHFTIE
jgi:FtsP/CotA-like multicopper oxidase with cupredoxin domain